MNFFTIREWLLVSVLGLVIAGTSALLWANMHLKAKIAEQCKEFKMQITTDYKGDLTCISMKDMV